MKNKSDTLERMARRKRTWRLIFYFYIWSWWSQDISSLLIKGNLQLVTFYLSGQNTSVKSVEFW